MEAKAQARYVRVTPQKARRVVDLIRGKQALEAVAVLEFAPQAVSETVRKVVQSATANARVKAAAASEPFDERLYVVQTAFVDEGPTLKRFRPRAQGRACPNNKPTQPHHRRGGAAGYRAGPRRGPRRRRHQHDGPVEQADQQG